MEGYKHKLLVLGRCEDSVETLLQSCEFEITRPATFDDIVLTELDAGSLYVLLAVTLNFDYSLIQSLPTSWFVIIWHPLATEAPHVRLNAFTAGANMVTNSITQLGDTLSTLRSQKGAGSVTCEFCHMRYLSRCDYWHHLPLYHVTSPNISAHCQICGKHTRNLAVHVHEAHGPEGPAPEKRTGRYAVVIVRRPSDGKFLMVQEFANVWFWLPGGGVDFGETFSQGAIREAMEEAGVEVVLKGVLAADFDLSESWTRIIFYAEPTDSTVVPKTMPDFESAGACWVDIATLPSLPLREEHTPNKWFTHVANGGDILPLQVPDYCQHAFAGMEF